MSDKIIGPGPTGDYLNTVDKVKKITPAKLPDTNKAIKRMKEMKKNVVVVKVDEKAIQEELKSMISGLVSEIKDLKIKVNKIERTIRDYGIYK